jgi:primase-polymerase (primpol)-like protein
VSARRAARGRTKRRSDTLGASLRLLFDVEPGAFHAGKIESRDSATWGSYPEALARYLRDSRLTGIGLVFSKADLEDEPDKPTNEYADIDLDGCRNSETGEIEPWATRLAPRLCC